MPDPFRPTQFHFDRYGFGAQSSLSKTNLWEAFKSIQIGSPQTLSSTPEAVSLSSFYKGGSFVSDSDGNVLTNVPTSGRISFGNFRIKPYFDIVYTGNQVSDQNFTLNIPERCGYSHMKIFIQGAGASGHIGAWSWFGRNNLSSSLISAPAGGNAGDYAETLPVPVTGGDVLTIQAGKGGVPPAPTYGNLSQPSQIWGYRGTDNAQSGGNSYVYKNGANVLTVGGAQKGTNYQRTSSLDGNTRSLETHNFYIAGYANGPGTGNRVTIYDNSKLALHYAGGVGGTGRIVACLNSTGTTLNGSPTFNYYQTGGGGAPGYYAGSNVLSDGRDSVIRGKGMGWRVSYQDWIEEATGVGAGGVGPFGGGSGTAGGKGFNEIFTRETNSTNGYGYGGGGVKGQLTMTVTNSVKGGPGFVRIMFYDADDLSHTTGITYDRTKARFPG